MLCVAVALIHVRDQGGFPGSKDPGYVAIGYYALEATAAVCALLLLVPGPWLGRFAWPLAAGVAFGPMIGYVLSRGPGLPYYSDDKGNWTEPLGLLSLAVELGLLLIAIRCVFHRPVEEVRTVQQSSPARVSAD
jgi:hypothetical protein